MKLTYMIGNGFDIGLGFNTRYVDFVGFLVKELEEYLHPGHPGVSESDRNFGIWLLEQIRDHKQEFWSDAELAFGALFFTGCGGDVADGVKFAHSTFQICMNRWLKGELARVSWSKVDMEDISSVFIIACITGWLCGATDGQKRRFFDKAGDDPIELNFITFNYTDIIERIIADRKGVLFAFDYYGYSYNIKIGRVCHVHGSLSHRDMDASLVFGVDNGDQLVDNTVRHDAEVNARLVKANYQGYVDNGNVEDATSIIANSDYLVSYGLSFGVTDRFWWKRLYSFVTDTSKRLIVCPYIRSGTERDRSTDIIRYKRWLVGNIFKNLENGTIQDMTYNSIIRQIVDVKPREIEEMHGKRVLCDYLQLNSIGRALGLI